MTAPIIMLIIGLLLVFVEFFLPGGILGVAGGVLIVLAVVFAFINSATFTPPLIFLAVTIALTAALIRFALWRIKREKSGSIYLNTDQAGYSASTFAKELIGSEGVALSDLKPAGHIIIEGKRYQAVSKTGYLEKGAPVIVIGGDGAHLIVKTKEEK